MSTVSVSIYRSTSTRFARQLRQHHVCGACRVALAAAQPSTRPTWQTCESRRPRAVVPAAPHAQSFSTAYVYHKKSSTNPKSSRKSPSVDSPTPAEHIPDNKHTRKVDSEPDPYDHSELELAIDQATARLKDALTKARDAGRVSVQTINDLPVELTSKDHSGGSKNNNNGGGGGSSSKTRVRIGDVATVVPRGGRTIQVYLSEEALSKQVGAAIQASPHSLVPQPDPQNPLLLIVPVPPQTAETRAAAVAEAKRCFDRTGLEVRNARGDAQKRHKKMEQSKLVVPDELRKAHKSMEEVAKRGQDEVKKIYEAAVKSLQTV